MCGFPADLTPLSGGGDREPARPPSLLEFSHPSKQSILRAGGWALTLGGLVWVVLWLVAPRDVATPASIAAVAGASVVTIAYAVWRYRRFKSPSA
jgi:hypothetical protein